MSFKCVIGNVHIVMDFVKCGRAPVGPSRRVAGVIILRLPFGLTICITIMETNILNRSNRSKNITELIFCSRQW